MLHTILHSFFPAPDPDTVIRSLINLERGSALQDSRIKQQFSTIPNEVWNVQAVEKITDRKRLETLLKSVDSSYELLSQHRIRLQVIAILMRFLKIVSDLDQHLLRNRINNTIIKYDV